MIAGNAASKLNFLMDTVRHTVVYMWVPQCVYGPPFLSPTESMVHCSYVPPLVHVFYNFNRPSFSIRPFAWFAFISSAVSSSKPYVHTMSTVSIWFHRAMAQQFMFPRFYRVYGKIPGFIVSIQISKV